MDVNHSCKYLIIFNNPTSYIFRLFENYFLSPPIFFNCHTYFAVAVTISRNVFTSFVFFIKSFPFIAAMMPKWRKLLRLSIRSYASLLLKIIFSSLLVKIIIIISLNENWFENYLTCFSQHNAIKVYLQYLIYFYFSWLNIFLDLKLHFIGENVNGS